MTLASRIAQAHRRIDVVQAELELLELEVSLWAQSAQKRAHSQAGQPVSASVSIPDADERRELIGELAWLLGPGIKTIRQWVGVLAKRDLQLLTRGKIGRLEAGGALHRCLEAARASDEWDSPEALADIVRTFSRSVR